jgi:hypothetical protein
MLESVATATRHDPARFARLALRIPIGANPVYLNAILNGLADGKPPQQLGEGEKELWHSPSIDLLEPVMAQALDLNQA